MTKFTQDITDLALLAGLTWARETANAALTPEKDKDGKALPVTSHPSYVATDADYLTARVADMLTSYAKQAGYDQATLDVLKIEVAAREAKILGMK